MKVVEKERNWTLTCKCGGSGAFSHGCGNVLEVEISDIYSKADCDPDWPTTYSYHFRCCECGRENSIEKDYLPKVVQYEAMYREDPGFKKDVKVKTKGTKKN